MFEISTEVPKELVRITPEGKVHLKDHVYDSWEEVIDLLNKLLYQAREMGWELPEEGK